MTALHNFIRAAASYYGVPVDQLTEGCAVDSSTGEFEVVLRFAVSPDDLAGIGKRMEVMMRETEVDQAIADKAAAQAQEHAGAAVVSDKVLRERYNALPAHQKSAFGSFAKYKAKWNESALAAQVKQGVALPEHVWIDGRELTNQQIALAMSSDARGRFAMDPNDLIPEQLAKAEEA